MSTIETRLGPRRLALTCLALTLALSLAPLSRATAQVQSFEDVNPDKSTLDPIDPDGATGGRVNGIVVDPNNASVLYAASELGGVYKSTNAGRNWFRLNGHKPTAVWDVAVDPSNSNRIYATSFFDGRKSTDTQSGISQSNNGGTTWTHETLPPNNFCANPADQTEFTAFGISIDPTDSSNVYIGTSCGLARTLNSGGSWSFFKPPPGGGRIWDVLVSADGAFVDTCGDFGHWWMNTANGQWQQSQANQLPSGRCSLAVSPYSQVNLLATVGTKIYESPDGAQWGEVRTNPSPQGRIPFVATNRRSSAPAGTRFDLWFGDVSLHRVQCTQNTFPNFSCFAGNWIGPFTRSVGGHDDMGDIAFNPSVSNDACPILMSSDGGVYYNTKNSTPGCHSPTWEQPNVSPHGLWPFSMSGSYRPGQTSEDLYFGNQDNGVFGTLNAGATKPNWENEVCCDGFDTAANDFNGGSIIYSVCCGPGRGTRYYKKGAGFAGGGELNNYPPGDPPTFKYPDAYARFGDRHYVMVTKGAQGGVFFTNNIDVTPINWQPLGNSNKPPAANICGVRAGLVRTTPMFYVQTGNCNADTSSVNDRMYRFVGATTSGAWTEITLPQGGFGVFALNENNANQLLAGGFTNNDARMYKSTDGGNTWTSLPALDNLMRGNGDFPIRNFRGPTDFTGMNGYHQPSLVAIDPTDPKIMVAGGRDSGVFLTSNAGITWALVTDPRHTSGAPHLPRPRFAYFNQEGSNKWVYLASQGRGIWRLKLGGNSCGTTNVTVNKTVSGTEFYAATNNITLGGNLNVTGSGRLLLDAGNQITLLNGATIGGLLESFAGGITICGPSIGPLERVTSAGR